MSQPNSRIRSIDLLSARSGGTEDVDADVSIGDLDLDLGGLGHDGNSDGGGVDAALGFCGGDALDAVDA